MQSIHLKETNAQCRLSLIYFEILNIMMVEMISKMIVRDNGGDGGEDYFCGNDDDDDFCDGHGGD